MFVQFFKLLKETPPLGPKFATSVKVSINYLNKKTLLIIIFFKTFFLKHILEREDIWNKWKNEGCQNFVKEKRAAATQSAQKA